LRAAPVIFFLVGSQGAREPGYVQKIFPHTPVRLSKFFLTPL